MTTACRNLKKVTHVLFDMDGVLLDSEVLYKRAISKIASRFGKVYTAEIRSKLLGSPERECSKIAVEEMKLPMSVDKFQLEFRRLAHSYMASVSLMPGARHLVTHLKTHKIPIAVATSSSRESYDLKTKDHKEFFCMFDHIVTGASDPEVKQGKPSPDIFLVCASRFPDSPCSEKCLVFEDAPNGVLAAVRAGMQVIMVPDENIPPEHTKEAHVVIKNLEEAPIEYFGLPPLKKL
ncbi:unnamed protein product [Psylliodes chrysocephalus]|uniref:Pseudouridine-5'-phosphatase n=1 Tax=Psylliodes chrysocephalus TaxID=3402493 RepID=A0A9P0G771_9CUCU|nr:unnamed protein product [Psylliodes chrysocephala]